MISMGLIRYSCCHISGPHELIPTKFGLWMFFIILNAVMSSLLYSEVKWTIPQNHNFEKIKYKVLTLLENQGSSCKRKIFAKGLQLLLSLYNLFILPKIPCRIVLKIVKMWDTKKLHTQPGSKFIQRIIWNLLQMYEITFMFSFSQTGILLHIRQHWLLLVW